MTGQSLQQVQGGVVVCLFPVTLDGDHPNQPSRVANRRVHQREGAALVANEPKPIDLIRLILTEEQLWTLLHGATHHWGWIPVRRKVRRQLAALTVHTVEVCQILKLLRLLVPQLEPAAIPVD